MLKTGFLKFDRAKRRMYKRYERAEFLNKEPSEKDLSYEEYYQWLDRAVIAAFPPRKKP